MQSSEPGPFGFSPNQMKQGLFWGVVIFAAFYLLVVFQSILTPFLTGLVIAYLLNPLVNKLESYNAPRWLAVLLILLSFLTVILGALALGVPLLISEVGLLVENLPQFFDALQVWVTQMMAHLTPFLGNFDTQTAFESLKEQASNVLGVGKHVLSGILAGGSAIIGVIVSALLIPIVAFYLMLDWPNFTTQVDNLLPRAQAPTIRRLLNEIDRTIAGFIRGQLTVCLCLGLYYGLGLALLGLDFGFVLGLTAGALTIIPYVGSTIGLVASIGMAWYQTGDMVMVGLAAGIFAVGQFVEGNILTPKMVGENVGLHPIWIIFALMAGGSLLGFVGMLVAVPVAAIIGVLVRFFINEYKKSRYYAQ